MLHEAHVKYDGRLPENYVLQLAAVVAASAVAFWVLFLSCLLLFRRLRFSDMLSAEMAECVCSTVHALVVSVGLNGTLSRSGVVYAWRELVLYDTMTWFCVSLAYFVCDSIVLGFYRWKMWDIFLVHHLFASLPYFIFVFSPECHTSDNVAGVFTLAGFLLVEWATPLYNLCAFLKLLGKERSRQYSISFFIMYLAWCLVRVVLPANLVVWVFKDIYPAWGWHYCYGLSYPSAVFVLIFCTCALVLFHTPEALRIAGLLPPETPVPSAVPAAGKRTKAE
jgi:hypothetical protein